MHDPARMFCRLFFEKYYGTAWNEALLYLGALNICGSLRKGMPAQWVASSLVG